MENFLGSNFEELPFTYLGMPGGAKYKSKIIWDTLVGVENKETPLEVERKFSIYGGRLVTIMNVLISM